jgi:hypothetical protein
MANPNWIGICGTDFPDITINTITFQSLLGLQHVPAHALQNHILDSLVLVFGLIFLAVSA